MRRYLEPLSRPPRAVSRLEWGLITVSLSAGLCIGTALGFNLAPRVPDPLPVVSRPLEEVRDPKPGWALCPATSWSRPDGSRAWVYSCPDEEGK